MIAWILSVAVMIVAGVLSLEFWGWLPTLSRWLVWIATLSLPRERRALRRREFREELRGHYDERRIAGLAWTLQLALICIWERATAMNRPSGSKATHVCELITRRLSIRQLSRWGAVMVPGMTIVLTIAGGLNWLPGEKELLGLNEVHEGLEAFGRVMAVMWYSFLALCLGLLVFALTHRNIANRGANLDSNAEPQPDQH
jgi:hypothetical protein